MVAGSANSAGITDRITSKETVSVRGVTDTNKEIDVLPNPNQLLANLVAALNATYWSS